MAGFVALAVVVVVALWAVFTYNGLIRRRAVVAESWSGIDAQLKRRADLIPNLVETVKGYATHERSTLDELTRLRSAAGPGQESTENLEQRAKRESAITAAIGKIMAVAEAYPDLKASANFQALQGDLSEIEDQIQLARRYYNGAVRDYNVMVQQIPSNLIARFRDFQTSQFFQIENEADRSVPKVSFG